MLRSIYTNNQLSGSIAFLSTALLLLVLPPLTINSSFGIIFFGTLIGLLLSAIDPGRELVNPIINKSVAKLSDFEYGQVDFATTGLFSKKILDTYVARIYMVFGLIFTMLFFSFKGIPDTPFRSLDFTDLSVGILPTLIIVIVTFLTILWLIYKSSKEYNDDQATIANLTIFETYRTPIPYGFDWLDQSKRMSQLRVLLKNRRPVIEVLEKYLSVFDYRSFNHAIKGELIDVANAETLLVIENVVRTSDNKKSERIERIKELTNDNKIGKILESGVYCLSKTHHSMVYSINKLCAVIFESTKAINEYQSFLNAITNYIEFELPLQLVNPALVKELTAGQSSSFELSLDEIHKNEISKSMKKNGSSEIAIFGLIYDWLELIHNSNKYKEMNEVEKPILLEFDQKVMKIYLKTIRLKTGKGSSYSFNIGELFQFIIDYHVISADLPSDPSKGPDLSLDPQTARDLAIARSMHKSSDLRMVDTPSLHIFIKYIMELEKTRDAIWLYTTLKEPCVTFIENKIFSQFIARSRITVNVEKFSDYIANVQIKIGEIQKNINRVVSYSHVLFDQ
ncbi:MAG: hypothetical protein IH840_13805 [Candidatus Heimdallarchaeota archaeon]|nr:hypothetical protein [Candidatus Heimdallarchaeota archaeon]